jgi:AcrR family transcriptional regulator
MATVQRRIRERDLVKATRALFDERGMQDAPIEEIARAVGIARGLIYRQFASKEELFVLTVTDYLAELDATLADAIAGERDPVAALERCTEAFARFCKRYPAFLDCALSLMHRPARDLQEAVSESVWLRLGRGMGSCVQHLVDVLRAGVAAQAFAIEDPELTANLLWTQTLGAMHLARIRVGIHEEAPGLPALFRVEPADVVRACADSALATARGVR